MSESTVTTNIPRIRKPFGVEVPPRVPYLDGGVDDCGSETNPVFIRNRKFEACGEFGVTQNYLDGTLIATIKMANRSVGIYAPSGGGGSGAITTLKVPLLTPMWFDYKLSGDDATVWISPMDGSSVNQFSGTNTTYKKIYDHLKNEYSGGNVTDTYTLTDGSTVTITYKLASDGHKICTPGQITNLGKIYDDPSIGTAWYYVLNTTGSASNGLAATSFMLPRTKFGFHGAGGYAKIPIAVSSNVQTNLTEKEMFLYFYTGTEDNSLTDLSKGRLINITTPSGNTRTRTVEVNVADNLKSGAGTAAMPIVGMSGNNSFVGKNLGFLLDHDAANNTIKVKSNFTGDASFVGVSNGQLVATDPPSNKLSILDIYPVGSVYISVYGQFDPNVSFGGTWERFGSGRCLWGAKLDNSDLGVTISAGLPTIPNHSHDLIIGSVMPASSSQSGAALHGKPNTCNCYSSTKSSITQSADIIYGKSSTVQPPAIGVIFWKRIN